MTYLSNESSIIEYWTYVVYYQLSYTFIKQRETLKTS
jgi:hypothetical protein